MPTVTIVGVPVSYAGTKLRQSVQHRVAGAGIRHDFRPAFEVELP